MVSDFLFASYDFYCFVFMYNKVNKKIHKIFISFLIFLSCDGGIIMSWPCV